MYKKILVAYDRSSQSRAALTTAIEMLDCKMAENVIILSVIDNHEDDPTFEIAARIAGLIDDPTPLEDKTPLVELETSLVELIKDHDAQCETLVMRGKAADVIVNAARDYGCDLIMMGRRGVGALQSVMGSVSTAVLRNSELPVLVTR
ncbi:MAG: universal stress protein [Coriobacteriia bacterium]|nr:universal stress protein [Coriobacteriia bacterium]